MENLSNISNTTTTSFRICISSLEAGADREARVIPKLKIRCMESVQDYSET
jgi:hypothetical protein